MKIKYRQKKIAIILLLVCAAGAAHGAEDSISSRIRTEHPPEEKPYQFPQWAKDLRRADIIAFGVFPFAWFVSTIMIDAQRVAGHDGDMSYYTGLFTQLINGSSTVKAWGTDEYINSFTVSGALCVSVALTDFIIIKIKRSRAEKKAREQQGREAEIKRTPLRGVPLGEIEPVSPLLPPQGD
jgi:hypothetical protein